MYTIGTLIYGVPLTKAMITIMEKKEKCEEPEAFGFETMYSGSSDIEPGFLGVVLGGLDETKHVCLDDLKLKITQATEKTFEKKYDKLPDSLKPLCSNPKIWIIWSTS